MEKPADPFNNPNDELRLEPRTDATRQSPELSVGLTKPPYPVREYVYVSEDEAYQFRRPDVAYNDGSNIQDLPDGVQSDGTPPRHWGEAPTAHEDNTQVIRKSGKEKS
jgi:hypothetical protein